jgi:hypothetical protein
VSAGGFRTLALSGSAAGLIQSARCRIPGRAIKAAEHFLWYSDGDRKVKSRRWATDFFTCDNY